MTPAFHLTCGACGNRFPSSQHHDDPRCPLHRFCAEPGCRALVKRHGARCAKHWNHAARVAPEAGPGTRRCQCGNLLSRFNRGDRCHACEAARAVARLRGGAG